MRATNELFTTALNSEILSASENWVIEKIKIGKNLYCGPQSGFSYMKFGEFVFLDTMFLNYDITMSEKDLDVIMSVLYRKQKNTFGDVREAFDDASVSSRAVEWSYVPFEMKFNILTNYKLVRSAISQKYPLVFKGGTNAPAQKKSCNNWISVRDILAGEALDFDRIDNLLMSDVLRTLNTKIAADEQKK